MDFLKVVFRASTNMNSYSKYPYSLRASRACPNLTQNKGLFARRAKLLDDQKRTDLKGLSHKILVSFLRFHWIAMRFILGQDREYFSF
jgi:hypothetical protein